MSRLAIIREAPTVWNYLQGVICVYKPLEMSPHFIANLLKKKLCYDLNGMVVREPKIHVQFRRIQDGPMTPSTSSSMTSLALQDLDKDKEIVGRIEDGPDVIEIVKGPSYADHPLVVGPRYQTEDFKILCTTYIGKDSSGIALFGLQSNGIRIARRIKEARWLRTYIVSGKFGITTDNMFHTGKIVEKTTFHHIRPYILDRLLSSSQSSHQRSMYQAAGVTMNSERAFELASQGPLRPDNDTTPIIYSLKRVKFDLPDFEIEIQTINEDEDYLKSLIHQFGQRLRSTAVCTKIRLVRYGPFTLDNALLHKHWNLENIGTNLAECDEVLQRVGTRKREPLIEETKKGIPEGMKDSIKRYT